VTSVEAALDALGVTSGALPAEAYAELDDRGFVVLPEVIDPDWLEQIRDRLAELQEREGRAAAHEVGGGQPGADLLADLINKGEMFERMLREPRVLAGVRHVLGDFRVNSLNARAARPGEGDQHLHSDCGAARGDGRFKICNSIWLVDDFTADNGATRAVPGTHRSGQLPAEVMDDVFAPNPDEVLLTAEAGTVIVFNAHVWHGGTRNRTAAPRRGLTLSFCRRDEPQQLNQAEYIRPAVYERLSPAERYLLDV
jgi:ectoine hydroxylase-related dioxygenase (phytanoyl-CoA dioxygenase family)